MTIQIRNVTISGIFAESATTTIPEIPVAGQSYRDTELSVADVQYGWPFKEIVDSSKFNQYLYEISTLNKQIETYGFLPWSDLTDYEAGSCCLGTDGKIYQAKQNTGPSSTAYNPVNDTNHTYWNVGFARVIDDNDWTGSNTFPTQSTSDASTKAANTQYVKNCVPKNVGASNKPVYTNADGTVTASTSTIGESMQPVYITNGAITACGFKIAIVNSLPSTTDPETLYFVTG